jgi:ABC-2 type transport system permease protein
MTSVFSSTFSSASYYRDRDTGILRMFLSSPHSPRTILFGKSLAGVVIGALQAAVVFVVAAPFVDFDWQYGVIPGLLIAIAAIVLMNVMLTGLAQALASRIQTMQGFHLLMNLALFPLLFFSGAFFPIEDLPMWLRILAYANPLTYAVDALELAAYASDDSPFIGLAIDFIVLGALSVATFVLGLGRTPRLTYSGE